MTSQTSVRKIAKVLVVDDHPSVAFTFAYYLKHHGFEARMTTDADEALRFCRMDPPDVILADLHLKGRDGVGLMEAVREEFPDVRVILITADSHGPTIRAALAANPDGFVHKDDQLPEMLRALNEVASGARHFSREITAARRSTSRNAAEDLIHLVTPKEREVWKLLAEGHSLKSAAATLGKSESTVDKQRTHLMERLGVHKAADLTRLAIEAGLVARHANFNLPRRGGL